MVLNLKNEKFKKNLVTTVQAEQLYETILNLVGTRVRDKAKRTKLGDHMYCPCSQQNIFQHFENLKKFWKQIKNIIFFFKFTIALISETVGDRAFFNILKNLKFLKNIKKHKFALISETVRAKRTEFGDGISCQCSQQNILKIWKI